MSEDKIRRRAQEMERQQESSLANIKELQEMEKKLYTKLQESSVSGEGNLDSDMNTIDRINKLSNMRTDLYNQMSQTYTSLTRNVASNRNDLVNQTALVKIIEEELNKTKKDLRKRDNNKYNKLRMIEINTYEAKRLNESKKLVIGVLFMCVALIVLTILYNIRLIGGNTSKYLFVLIIVGGLIYLGSILMDISKRDNMNFDEYDFEFDPVATKAALNSKNSNKKSSSGSCENNNCCSEGTLWSKELSKCISSDTLLGNLKKDTKENTTDSGKSSKKSLTSLVKGIETDAEGFTTSGHEQLKKHQN